MKACEMGSITVKACERPLQPIAHQMVSFRRSSKEICKEERKDQSVKDVFSNRSKHVESSTDNITTSI